MCVRTQMALEAKELLGDGSGDVDLLNIAPQKIDWSVVPQPLMIWHCEDEKLGRRTVHLTSCEDHGLLGFVTRADGSACDPL